MVKDVRVGQGSLKSYNRLVLEVFFSSAVTAEQNRFPKTPRIYLCVSWREVGLSEIDLVGFYQFSSFQYAVIRQLNGVSSHKPNFSDVMPMLLYVGREI